MTITYLSLLLGLAGMLAPLAYLLYVCDTRLLTKLLAGTLRMVVQLAMVGAYVKALYHFDLLWLNLLWLLVMSGVGGWVIVSRAELDKRRLFAPAALGLLAGVAVMSALLLLVVIRPERPLSAQWLVPVSAVLLAHVAASGVRALGTFCKTMQSDTQAYYTLLGNGLSHFRALMPYVRPALQSLLLPAVANLSVMGLFVLPALLTGQLLGGISPVEAVKLTVLLCVGCLCASVIAFAVTLLLADRSLFDRSGNMIEEQ